jgi:Amt family ammonium transporter
MGLSDATIESKWFFQFVFCAVSLAIVWGTTLERIKFGVYVIYAIVFAGFIYPIGSPLGVRRRLAAGQPRHAGLRRLDAVHLIGDRRARGAPALGRRGKYGKDGKPRRSRATTCRCSARRADPVARLVRVQPGLDARRD